MLTPVKIPEAHTKIMPIFLPISYKVEATGLCHLNGILPIRKSQIQSWFKELLK